ncbi:MAG: hypothetical protein ACD_5C00314G0002 [uncultured bacterium]|nr:MAG: hypothetical protein ACD_5C00314G0002 [uncultured bacterium]
MTNEKLDELGGNALITVPFRFKGVNECDAIVTMPPGFFFTKEILDCVEYVLGIKAFDAFAIPAFSKRIVDGSETVLETLEIANKKHRVDKIINFQSVDVHKKGKSDRFSNQQEEDDFHISGLMASKALILKYYPEMEVVSIYVTLSEDHALIRMYEIHDDGTREVIFRPKYRFKGICQCDTAVIRCIEFRNRKEDRSFVRFSLGFDSFGLIGFAGASRPFLKGSKSAWKAISLACNHEGCKRIILMHHADCGAYKKDHDFKGDLVAEEIMHRDEMRKMKEKILEKYPDVEVIMVYVRMIEDFTKLQYVIFE